MATLSSPMQDARTALFDQAKSLLRMDLAKTTSGKYSRQRRTQTGHFVVSADDIGGCGPLRQALFGGYVDGMWLLLEHCYCQWAMFGI